MAPDVFNRDPAEGSREIVERELKRMDAKQRKAGEQARTSPTKGASTQEAGAQQRSRGRS